jgi:hypothetical protein
MDYANQLEAVKEAFGMLKRAQIWYGKTRIAYLDIVRK